MNRHSKLIACVTGIVLSAAAAAQNGGQDAGQFSLRAGIAGSVTRGDFLPAITGRSALKTDDVYKTARQFSLGFGFALSPESQVTFDVTRRSAEGKKIALRSAAIASALSDSRSTSAMLGFEYALNGLAQSGFVLGAGIGYERLDAITVASAPVANRVLFNKSNGLTADVRAGYQFAVADNALLKLSITPTHSAKRKVNSANAAFLGLGKIVGESSVSVPLNLQFEYRF